MNKKEYLKNYKKYHYHKTRKIVSFPLFCEEYEVLLARAEKSSLTANSMAKQLVLNFIENRNDSFISTAQKKMISEYMRISRGLANNINQMAHASNIGEVVDVHILIQSLKQYEDEFRNLVAKLNL